MKSDNKILTIILPIRVTEDRINLIEQLDYINLDKNNKNIEFIVVDDGSSLFYREKIEKKCNILNIKYIFVNTENRDFSIARARNRGAESSSTPFIMFQDIDMMPYKGFYKELINEIKIQNLFNKPTHFIMIGTIYLTQKGTKEYKPHLKNLFIDRLLLNDKEYIDRYSTATSLIIINKDFFLSLNGYDEKFEKWGHEDIDFNCRIILKNNLVKLPEEFILDEKNFNNIFEYKGWKSIYRLYGDRTFIKGIVLFHSWHPISIDNDYYANRTKNKNYFHTKLKGYLKEYKQKSGYVLSKESILFDRYKYALSPNNRLKCKSFFYAIYYKLKKFF